MQERFDFLAKYRHAVPEEDFEVAMKAYEWPKKFVSIMKEAATKATSGKQAHCYRSCLGYQQSQLECFLVCTAFAMAKSPIKHPAPSKCVQLFIYKAISIKPMKSQLMAVVRCMGKTLLIDFHAAQFCAAEQREFEANLKKRKREFGETLERYEADVDKYAQRSELSKRDEVAAQVTDLSQKLKEVSEVRRVCQ